MKSSVLVAMGCVVVFGLTPAPANAGGGHEHSRSSSEGHDGPVADCSGLHIRMDDREAVMQSEEKTISKAEAGTLRVHAEKNGGVQVQGWEKDIYSVTICKAARAGGDAEKVLSQIAMKVSNGEVSVSGPEDREEWTAFLLIRAPKTAAMDVEAINGPLSFFGVEGKLTVHAVNGPITLKDFSGDADVSATNGPISVSGSAGNLRVHTQNGPITVALQGSAWSGSGLVADAQNGPVTLQVPSGFQSGFVVESKGYSPVSCRANVCDQARKTWDDDHKRIEYGASPAVIRLSTVNGPVAVQQSKEKL